MSSSVSTTKRWSDMMDEWDAENPASPPPSPPPSEEPTSSSASTRRVARRSFQLDERLSKGFESRLLTITEKNPQSFEEYSHSLRYLAESVKQANVKTKQLLLKTFKHLLDPITKSMAPVINQFCPSDKDETYHIVSFTTSLRHLQYHAASILAPLRALILQNMGAMDIADLISVIWSMAILKNRDTHFYRQLSNRLCTLLSELDENLLEFNLQEFGKLAYAFEVVQFTPPKDFFDLLEYSSLDRFNEFTLLTRCQILHSLAVNKVHRPSLSSHLITTLCHDFRELALNLKISLLWSLTILQERFGLLKEDPSHINALNQSIVDSFVCNDHCYPSDLVYLLNALPQSSTALHETMITKICERMEARRLTILSPKENGILVLSLQKINSPQKERLRRAFQCVKIQYVD